MSYKLLVGNLTSSTDDLRLSELFSPYGSVAGAHVIDSMDLAAGMRGYVEMEREADALAAIASLNGRVVDGQEMSVSAAPEPEPEPPFPHRFGNGRSGHSRMRSGAGTEEAN